MKRAAVSLLAGVGLAGIALLAMGALGAFERPATYHGTHLDPPMPAVDFTLESADGPVSRADLEGKIVPVFFGFTSCPDVCPITLQRLSQALEQVERGREDVQVVFVSVDPERDTPEQASAYAEGFDPSFIGLSGSEAKIAEVASAYGIHRARMGGSSAEHAGAAGGMVGSGRAEAGHPDVSAGGANPADYMVEHSSTAVVLNREGGVELLWSSTVTAPQMAEDLAALLRR